MFLTKHLCIIRHAWIEAHDTPTKLIKITAILIPTILTILFIFVITFSSLVYSAYERNRYPQQSFVMDPDYPYIYTQIGIIQGCILGLLYFIFLWDMFMLSCFLYSVHLYFKYLDYI